MIKISQTDCRLAALFSLGNTFTNWANLGRLDPSAGLRSNVNSIAPVQKNWLLVFLSILYLQMPLLSCDLPKFDLFIDTHTMEQHLPTQFACCRFPHCTLALSLQPMLVRCEHVCIAWMKRSCEQARVHNNEFFVSHIVSFPLWTHVLDKHGQSRRCDACHRGRRILVE